MMFLECRYPMPRATSSAILSATVKGGGAVRPLRYLRRVPPGRSSVTRQWRGGFWHAPMNCSPVRERTHQGKCTHLLDGALLDQGLSLRLVLLAREAYRRSPLNSDAKLRNDETKTTMLRVGGCPWRKTNLVYDGI